MQHLFHSLLTAGLQADHAKREADLQVLAAVFDSLAEGLLVADASGVLRAMNRAAQGFFELTAEEMRGRHYTELVSGFVVRDQEGAELPPEAWPFARAVHGERFEGEQVEVMHPDTGHSWSCNCTSTPVFEEDGKLFLAILTLQDVSAQRQVEAARAQHALWYQTLFNAVDDEVLVYHLTPAGVLDRIIEVNDVACQRLGYTRDELLGMKISQVIAADSVDLAGALAALQRDGRLLIDSVHVAKDGRQLDVETSSVLFEHAGRPTVLSVCRDITSRKQVERALQERERAFTTMANSIPQLAWMTDETGWIFWYNQRWYDYTGTTREEMEGWGWQKVHHPEHVDHVTEHFKRAIERGEPWEDTFPLRSKDGTYRWFLSRALPIRDEAGRVERWFGTNTDITDRLEMEQSLREREQQLRRLNATLEARVAERTHDLEQVVRTLETRNRDLQDFAYIASHDLQEPLRKIGTFADLLVSDLGDTLAEEGRFYLERMQDAARRMSQLISGLLQFSRVQTRGETFQLVDLQATARDVLADLEVAVEETDAEVEVAVTGSLEADPTQMRQLLQNLVGNALKFRREGVTPVISIRAVLEPCGTEGTSSPDARLCVLTVEDNGIGFEEKYTERIFAPFQRLHGRGVYPGTGMGLAICRRIVERHGGTITAQSVPGEGSTFIVTLPRCQNGRVAGDGAGVLGER